MRIDLRGRTIALIGLGYVGLPLAVEFGKSRPIRGFDIKAGRLEGLQVGHDHTLESVARKITRGKAIDH